MSVRSRMTFIWLLSAALIAAFAPIPLAMAHGGGGGGGGHGGGGFGGGGGHFGGGGFGGGHFGGGGWGGGHVGSWGGGGWSGGHVGGWSGGHAFSGQQFSHSTPSIISPNRGNIQSFAGRSGTWNHAGNWNHSFAGNHGVWNHSQGWWNHHEPDRGDFFGFGTFGWPWYAFDWGPGSWWPNYYDYGYAPYGDLYGSYYDSGIAPYAYDSGVVPQTSANLASTAIETSPPEVGSETSDFYSEALIAFRQGDYGNATRMAGHAAVDDPRNPDVHILAMLGLFAMGEYRGAAMEAHAVAAMDHIPDWPTLYGFYENVIPYTEQLRKLEKFVGEHPSAAEGRFLLGFQYMMEGHKDAAKDQFTEAVKLTPRDTLAAKLLTQEGGTAPANNVVQPSPASPAERQARAKSPGSLRSAARNGSRCGRARPRRMTVPGAAARIPGRPYSRVSV